MSSETLHETLEAAMCEIPLRNVVSIFTGRGAVESLLNSGGRKIKLWGEDRSGRAKCEMRGVGTRGGNNGTDTEWGRKNLDIINATLISYKSRLDFLSFKHIFH